jgi:phosphoglycerol transferase
MMASEKTATPTRSRAVLPYAVVAVLSLLILVCVMQLWQADLSVPFRYDDDAVCFATWFQATAEGGWFLTNPRLGAPFTSKLHDFPRAEGTHFLLVRAGTVFTGDAVTAMNLYYLLSFPLAACFCLLMMRKIGLAILPAAVCSILFAFLPYHFMRYAHFPLACYWPVPLAGILIVQIARGEGVFFRFDRETGKPKLALRTRGALLAAILCILLATVELYYTIFACFFLVIAGGIVAIRARRPGRLLPAVAVIGIIAVVLVVTISPSMMFKASHGTNAEALHRPLEHVEKYGLKIAQMLLPVPGHRVGPLANLTDRYKREMLFNQDNENESSALGLVGSVGLVMLLGWMILRAIRPKARPDDSAEAERTDLFAALSGMTVVGVLLATVGGISVLVAMLGSTSVRSYNRISIYLAMFSFIAVAMLLERIFRSLSAKGKTPAVIAIAAAVLLVGVLDQTSPKLIPPYKTLKAEYDSDAAFVGQIEAALPEGAMVFQLPYVRFPEAWPLPPGRMINYDPFRGFLHSKTLRWSYGAVKGRPADLWQRDLASKPLDQIVQTLAVTGFSGIWVDRFGTGEKSAETEAAIGRLLGVQPLVSGNGRFVFFDMRPLVQRMKSQAPEAQWTAARTAAMEPILTNWTRGFGQPAGAPGNTFPYCKSSAELEIVNLSQRTRTVRLQLTVQAVEGPTGTLTVSGGLLSERLPLQNKTATLGRTVEVPPGSHKIRLSTDAKPFVDPRTGKRIAMKIAAFSVQPTN